MNVSLVGAWTAGGGLLAQYFTMKHVDAVVGDTSRDHSWKESVNPVTRVWFPTCVFTHIGKIPSLMRIFF